MSQSTLAEKNVAAQTLQLVTFTVGEATLALDISTVREINRNFELTYVPQAPAYVRGVTNLRGEVATIFDLHVLLGVPAQPAGVENRNLIVHHDGEVIGFWVDSVADIVTISPAELSEPPANIQGISRSLIRGVYQTPERLTLFIELDELLSSCNY